MEPTSLCNLMATSSSPKAFEFSAFSADFPQAYIMAASCKRFIATMLVVALLVQLICLPKYASAIRGLDVSDHAYAHTGASTHGSLEEVGELSIEEQQQVMQLQEKENMDEANRQLFAYDPYFSKWFGDHHH
ncbi:hypothetical protein GOP47_0019769 [Adiantum capillus-veneris]|uniref:Uncharacterized protein n=1 Tax=Adiantum capillus-veneris TaxID=13818 RepID=A0A9D4UBN9_ADICA|nr:hypothetical protein GOP47_0019769 [Adiantum capillus-veneris]